MTKVLREFRLIPIVLIAIACLFVLKSMGIVLDGGYTLAQRPSGGEKLVVSTVRPQTVDMVHRPASGAGKPSMKEMLNDPEVTGAVASAPTAPKDAPAPKDAKADAKADTKADAKPDAKPGAKPSAPASAPPPDAKSGTKIMLDAPPRAVSAGERALLERLQARRLELDARARELDVREGLLAAAEKKVDGKTAEQKTNDGKGGGAGRKDDPENRFKSLVTMYETMKPKEAAKIFDRLEIRVLLDVASQINPRVMSGILAQMSPEAAERLTVELATRGDASDKSVNPSDLPKIEGRPTN